MAVVDFSNAVLDVNGQSLRPIAYEYLAILDRAQLCDKYTQWITSGSSVVALSKTSSKIALLYTGTFTASGTEAYFYYTNLGATWKISNISFDIGDTYSFVIEIEVTGNA